jgi:cell surface protein SprA
MFFIYLFSVSNLSFAQGRRDIDGNKYVIYNFSDTSKFKLIDSTQLSSDTTKRAPVDSTARLKYFQYFPEYTYGLKIKEKIHPLLLENSTFVKTETSFDSSNNVLIRQTFMGEDIKAPVKVSLSKFLESLKENNSKKIFSDIFTEKFKGNVSDDLTKLFEKFTDITIPLPFKTETIFGPPTFNLRINGAVDITASYQNITSDQVVVSYLSNSQNNINFKQDVQVTAKGTVGDKLTIDADWNTQRTFDFENQLKLKYTGYADEVIKSIEAGNVSLDTKSSLIQSTQALFGVKGEFKLGPLNITTVISQKKSKQETKDYTGGSSEQGFQINVYDYSDNHYFFDTLYKSSFLDYMNSQNNTYTTQTQENQILVSDTYFEVWVQSEITEPQKRFAVAYTLLKDTASIDYNTLINSQQEPGIRAFGYFRKLNPNEYYVNPYAGFISLKVNVPDNYAVGVTYRTYNQKKFGRGSYDAPIPDTMILKMVKCANQNPQTTPDAWELKMKNVYRLPVSKIIEDGFTLEILYNRDNNYEPSIPGNSDKLIKITGLDRYTGKGRVPPPDGAFDYLAGLTIIPETGDIIFPSLRPFYDNLRLAGADSAFQYKDLYLERKSVAINSPLASKYIIKGTAKGEAGISNTINLGFNVVQGSVKVLNGTQELQNNVDYSVDYSTGVLVIRSASALTSQNLKITYETNDLFSIASKILIGARADYKFSEKTNLGFTFVNLKQETLNDKVRIGEEPTNNSVFGLDFATEIKTNFLTKLINLLPGFNTKEESVFRFKGEFAYMTPQPNTKKSRIPQDNNESIAYIDDMEGAKKTLPLGSTFNQWTMSSIPVDTSIGLVDSIRQFKRGRLKWYNIPNDVEIKKIYPLRDVQPGQDRLTPFYISFDPKQRGTYNYNRRMDTIQNKKTNWNGIMRYLNTTSTDLINENINYIEFNMRIDGNNAALSDGVIVIELGQISEDAIPNGILNTEDKNQNGTLQDDEDIGLDGLTNSEELAKYNQINGTNLSLTDLPDPALDDNGNAGTNTNLDVINGTENNRGTEGGNRPDTEDLNKNGMLDNTNQSYFTYTISLDTANNKRISGRGEPGSGWFQYRIPLSEFSKAINNPSLNNIDYARIWIKGVNDSIRIALVDLNLVGNQWIKPNKNDTSYNISVVSIEENPQIYQSPVAGDILRQTIRNTSGVNTKSNEQSLALQVNNLPNGGRKFAVKDYRTQTIDLFNYKTLKLFVNGDPSFNYVNENIYDAAMVIRFGSDSSNYYEYRAPIHPDVRPGQPWNSLNEVSIVFSDLTTIKLARDSVNQVVDVPVPNGPPGSIYRIKGNPALNTIRDFELGIEKNRTGLNATITGSVWYNEIRVLKVVDDNGYAMNINAGLKIADVADFSFNFSKIDPNYHSLDTRIGSRVTGQVWDMNLTLNAHKFINNALVSILSEDWKDFIYLPITFRHSENLANPKYYPGTDIDIDKAASERYRQVFIKTGDAALAQKAADGIRIESQALMVRNEFSVNGFNFKFPGNNYLVKTLLNSFTINFNGNLGNQRDFTYQSKTDFTYTGAMNFKTDFGLADLINLKIGKIINFGEEYKDAKLFLMLPFIPLAPLFSSDFNASIDFNRSRYEGRQRRLLIDDPIARQFTANRGFSFNWKFIENWIVDLTGNYSFRVGSDLAPFETYGDSLNTVRSENEIFKQIFFNEALINFGRDLNYQQTTVFNPKFNIPIIKKFLDITGSYNVTYGWNNPNTSTNIGYSVGYNNKIQASTNFKLKDLIGLFKSGSTSPLNKNLANGLRTNDDNPGLGDLLKILTTFIPDNISIAYNQDNTVLNPGVQGRPGFGNFWMVPGGAREELGPSRMYQLGFSMFPGKRVPGLQLTDNFAQINNLTLTATINPLIPQNIRMNLTFKSNWGAQNSASYISDPEGSLYNPTSKSSNSNKSYTIFFAGNVDKFNYTATEDLQSNTQNISSAFKSQLSSIPFPNWSLSISGVEKIPFFSEFASSVTIENSYTSEYSEAYSLDFRGISIPQRQGVTQSFSPLLGLNITFKEAFGGNLTASLRINNSKSNILTPTSNLIQVTNTNDWSINANYSKAGFEIPFFGLSLKNDISFALTISKNVTDPTDYKYSITGLEKAPGSGSAVTTINPSIQYSISSKVQMQLFFKYIRTEPTQQSATIIPRTSKEGGLNIRIQIQ